jgi:1,6-anhydro-N-acetylmuramate kinase
MPKDQITVQATNLNTLAGKLVLDVIGNFRELDVMRGGEGAPLAPYG